MEPLDQIDRYLDNRLPAEETAQFERELAWNADLQTLLDSVRLAREAVKTAALRAKVRSLHEQFVQELPPLAINDDRPQHGEAPIIALQTTRSSGWVLRIAASVLLAVAYGTYQYSTLNADGFYAANYVQYQLPVTRTAPTNPGSLDKLYHDADFPAVIRAFAQLPAQTPKDYFLTGLAHLHQKQFDQAIDRFAAVRQHSGESYEQETDYYLALAYVGAGRISEAYPLFDKIHKSPRHLYHRAVSNRDLWRLKLLRTKE